MFRRGLHDAEDDILSEEEIEEMKGISLSEEITRRVGQLLN